MSADDFNPLERYPALREEKPRIFCGAEIAFTSLTSWAERFRHQIRLTPGSSGTWPRSEKASRQTRRSSGTIPGISFYSALLISSEIGDISRFPDSSSLVAYAGLAPSTHSSGGTTRHGAITKQGSPYLRWILNQCARMHMRMEPEGTVATFYARLARKKGGSKAIVAASAKLLKVVFWVMKERRPYHS